MHPKPDFLLGLARIFSFLLGCFGFMAILVAIGFIFTALPSLGGLLLPLALLIFVILKR